MPKAIIFDVDGTLVDSNDMHTQAWARTFREFGFEIDTQAIRSQMGKGGDQLMPVFLPHDVVEREGEAISKCRAELFEKEYRPRVKAFPCVRDLFEALRAKGHTLALASSSKKHELEQSMKVAGVSDLVDVAVSGDDAENSKPQPDIFVATLKRLTPLHANDAMVVGDTPYDAQAARAAGLRTIGLLCGGFEESALREAGCVAIFRDPEDLLRRYEQSPLPDGLDTR